MKKEKNYRPNVAAVVVSSQYPSRCDVLIASRVGLKKPSWQFPQGGVDKGEDIKTALLRELKEEIGTNDIEIIAKYPKRVSYNFPDKIKYKMGNYDGQIQDYFLVRLNSGAKVDINTPKPEFSKYKFVPYKDIFKHVVKFKRTAYKEVLDYFQKEGYL